MATPGTHGDIGIFDPESEELYSHVERLEQYCEANDITIAQKKWAVLLNSCG